eukprot:365702-Chlamydomonas_euryale.AAC.37
MLHAPKPPLPTPDTRPEVSLPARAGCASLMVKRRPLPDRLPDQPTALTATGMGRCPAGRGGTGSTLTVLGSKSLPRP